MHSLSRHTSANNAPPDLASEISRLELLLAERRRELTGLQEALRAFKTGYTRIVGSRLAELDEIERAIKEVEKRLLGVEDDAADEALANEPDAAHAPQGKVTLRKLFWSVARLFHPDHAADEHEARRRHTIMAEANRAYREGDVDSLHTLLGDEQLQSYCAAAPAPDDAEDLAGRLFNLKEELRTIEFGIKRIRQDNLYRLKLSVDEDLQRGRDSLADMAERINRQIIKARHRLQHLS